MTRKGLRQSLCYPCRVMDRRSFFCSMIGGVATAAAVRTWPFRVYSFPSELRFLSIDELKKIYRERAMAELEYRILHAHHAAPYPGVVQS
jgi:hypothetical protein